RPRSAVGVRGAPRATHPLNNKIVATVKKMLLLLKLFWFLTLGAVKEVAFLDFSGDREYIYSRCGSDLICVLS
ncbi:MAG: hypothetical protein ACE5L7_04880, partial [Candidatus Aminicenantales bacterium]